MLILGSPILRLEQPRHLDGECARLTSTCHPPYPGRTLFVLITVWLTAFFSPVCLLGCYVKAMKGLPVSPGTWLMAAFGPLLLIGVYCVFIFLLVWLLARLPRRFSRNIVLYPKAIYCAGTLGVRRSDILSAAVVPLEDVAECWRFTVCFSRRRREWKWFLLTDDLTRARELAAMLDPATNQHSEEEQRTAWVIPAAAPISIKPVPRLEMVALCVLTAVLACAPVCARLWFPHASFAPWVPGFGHSTPEVERLHLKMYLQLVLGLTGCWLAKINLYLTGGKEAQSLKGAWLVSR